MAHYVAELMEAARTAPLESKNLAEDRCAAAILELWGHRADLSHRRVPMEIAPIVEVLHRLDPARVQPIYFLNTWQEMTREAANGQMSETAQLWLRTAEHVDQTARLIIVSALSKAAEAEADRAKQWVKLAEAAGADGAPDIQLIRRLVVLPAHDSPSTEPQIQELKDRLAKLAGLQTAAHAFELEWRAALSKLETETAAVSAASDGEAN